MMNKSRKVKIVRVNMEATQKASTLPTEPARPVPQESAKRQEGHIHLPQNDLLEEILTSYRAFCRSNGVKSTPIGMTSYLRSLQPGLFNQLKKLCRPLRICDLEKCRSNWQAKLIIVPVYRQGRDIGLITNTEWLESQVQKFKEKLQNRKASARELVTGPYTARRLTLDQVPDELMAPISPVKGRIWLNIQKNQFNKTVAALFRGSRKAMIDRIALNAKPEFRKLTYYLFIDRILNKYLFKAAMRVFARDHKKILGEYCDVTLQEHYDKLRAAKPLKKPVRVVVTRKTAAEKLDQQKKEHEQKAVRRNPQPQPSKPVVIDLPDIGKQLDTLMDAIAFRLRKERDATTTNIPLLIQDLKALVPKLCPNCAEAGHDAVDEIIEQFKGGLRGGSTYEEEIPPPPPLDPPYIETTTEPVYGFECRPSHSLDIDPIDIEWWQAHEIDSPSEYETDLSTDEEIDRQHADSNVITQAGVQIQQSESSDWATEAPRSLDDLRTVWRTVSYKSDDAIDMQHESTSDIEINDPTAEIAVPPDQGIVYESEHELSYSSSNTSDDVVVPCVDYETPGKLEEVPINIEAPEVVNVGDDGQETRKPADFNSLTNSEQLVLLADHVEKMDDELREVGIYPPTQQQLLDKIKSVNAQEADEHISTVQRIREERQKRRQFRTQIKQIAAKRNLLLGAKTSIQRQPECFTTPQPKENPLETTVARKQMDSDKVSGLYDPVPDVSSDRKDRVECKRIRRPPGCLFVTTTTKHEVVDEKGNYYNGPPLIRKREPIKILPKNAVGMITRLGHPIIVDITLMRKTTTKSHYFYINQLVDYPWDFHPVAIQGDHVIHWLDPLHPHFKRDKVGGSDSEDDQGVMSDDGGGDGYDDMGDEAEVVEEDSKNKAKNKKSKAEDNDAPNNDWEERSDKDEKIDLDYTKKFSPLQYMIASAMAFSLVQINLAFIFLYFLILLGLPATRWSSRIKKVFSNDVDRRPATKSTMNRQLIVSTLRKTRGIYNPFFGWIYKWSRTESDFNDTMVQMYAWETANKLEKPDKSLFYARYKDQINNSVNQVERWRKATLKAMKIVDRQRAYVPATFWLLTYLVGYSAAATDNIPIKPTKPGFHMNVSPIDQKDPTVWYGLLSPKEMSRLEYAPCVPDRNDQENTVLGAINRIGVDNSELLDITKYESAIDLVIDELFTGYTDVAPPLDSDAMYEWILTRPYTAHQVRELLETLSILNTMDLTYEDIITRREWQTMGFGKNENYEKYKFMRMICAGGPMRKLIYGPLFQGLSDWFFKQPWSMKKISSHERGEWLAAKFPKYGHYYVTDHSNFECSATSQVQDAIEMKIYRKFIHPSNHQFLEFLSHGIKGGHTIYTRKGVVIHTPVVRNSGEMNTSLGNSILNAVSAKVAFDTLGAKIDFVVEGDDGLILSDKYVDPQDIQRIMSEMGCRIKIEYHHSMETTSFCSTCFVDGTPTTDWKRNFVKVPWKSTYTSEEDRLTELKRKIGSLAMNARNSAISKALVQFYHTVEASFPNDMYIKETLLEPLRVAYEYLPTTEHAKTLAADIGYKVVDTTAALKDILAEGVTDAKDLLKTGYNALKKDPEFTGKERIEKLEARIEQLHMLLEKQQEVITDMGKMVFQYSQNFSEIITNIPAKILDQLRQPINFTDIYNDASTMKVPMPVIENAVNLIMAGKLPEAINSVYSSIPETTDLHDMADNNIKNSTAGESPGGFRYTRPPQQFQFLDAFKKYRFRQFSSAFGVALSVGDYLLQFASPEFWLITLMAIFIIMDQLIPLSPTVLLVLFNGNIFAYLAASILLVRTNRYFRVFISVFGAVVMNLFLFGPFAFGFIAGLGGQNHYNKF